MLKKLKLYFIDSNIKALVKQRDGLLVEIMQSQHGIVVIEAEIRLQQEERNRLTMQQVAA